MIGKVMKATAVYSALSHGSVPTTAASLLSAHDEIQAAWPSELVFEDMPLVLRFSSTNRMAPSGRRRPSRAMRKLRAQCSVYRLAAGLGTPLSR